MGSGRFLKLMGCEQLGLGRRREEIISINLKREQIYVF
jgi:hypothetical protein